MGVVVVPIQDLADGVVIDKWLSVKKNRKSDSNQGELHVRLLHALEKDLVRFWVDIFLFFGFSDSHINVGARDSTVQSRLPA